MTIYSPEAMAAIGAAQTAETPNPQQLGNKTNFSDLPLPAEVIQRIRLGDQYQADLISELISPHELSILDPEVEQELQAIRGRLALSRVALHRADGITAAEQDAIAEQAAAMTKKWKSIGGTLLERTMDGSIVARPPEAEEETAEEKASSDEQASVDDTQEGMSTESFENIDPLAIDFPELNPEPPAISGPLLLGKKVLAVLKKIEDRFYKDGDYEELIIEEYADE